jgi:hypothetical protein
LNLIDFPGTITVYSESQMRRLSSISLIAVLLWSVLSPASAAVHHMTGTRETCHGMKAVHHCESMVQEEDQDDSSPVLLVSSKTPNCPMDCCMQSCQNSGIAVTAAFVLPMGAVADRILATTSSVFTHNGFSSHTDRGPPSV